MRFTQSNKKLTCFTDALNIFRSTDLQQIFRFVGFRLAFKKLSASNQSEEIKVIYYIDDEETPYLTKLHCNQNHQIKLHDLKSALGSKRFNHFRFFFKSFDVDIGEVKEEINDNSATLPCENGKIVTWIVPVGNHTNVILSDDSTSSSGPGSIQSAPANKKCPPLRNQSTCASNTTLNSVHYSAAINLVDSLDDNTETECSSISHSQKKGSFMYSDGDAFESDSDRYALVNQRLKQKRMKPAGFYRKFSAMSTGSGSTLSMNVITVTLDLSSVPFLGVSIVGRSASGLPYKEYGNHGIYVGSIMKGGAVALDGRIEPGDMILQVNDVSFEGLTNDRAVFELRRAVQSPGSITLIVAKGWNPNPSGYFSLDRNQVARPIDPSTWAAQTKASMENKKIEGCYSSMDRLPRSPSSTTSTFQSTCRTNNFQFDASTSDLNLTINCDMENIANAMSCHNSGLDVKDRMWLKVRIPDAFLGSDVVDWLYNHVEGFADRRDARKYASNMLKAGYIRTTVNKINFSEQCYYVFGDICKDFSQLMVENVDQRGFTSSIAESSFAHNPNFHHADGYHNREILNMGKRPLPAIRDRNGTTGDDFSLDGSSNSDVTLVEHDAYHFPSTPTVLSTAHFKKSTKPCVSVDNSDTSDNSLSDKLSESGFDRPYHSTAINSPVNVRRAASRKGNMY
ncbi:hypothetical protein GJ496_000070 [Pomphorhynchus laevis]|nr:hypothetical protein GJ496_000070 [Pomphorhynchus laevis]